MNPLDSAERLQTAALVLAAVLPALLWLGQPVEVVTVTAPYWLAVLLALMAVLFNTALNWVLIYGHLGLTGAGIATALATWLTVASQMTLCHARPQLREHFGEVTPDPRRRARLRHRALRRIGTKLSALAHPLQQGGQIMAFGLARPGRGRSVTRGWREPPTAPALPLEARHTALSDPT